MSATAMRSICTLFLAFALWTASPAGAEPQRFSSGERQNRLIELYTSEGCSSCPPADRWLSGFKASPDLWKLYVPVSLHVDYWNYLGWDDRFSQKAHSRRQSRYQRQGGVASVYTPGFVINGTEWKGFFRGDTALPDASDITGDPVGELSLEIDGAEFHAQFAARPGAAQGPYDLTIGLLGMDLQTRVDAGENRNRRLAHDFVLLDQQTYRSTSGQWAGTLEFYLDEVAPRYALVAWVSRPGAQAPVQSTGGWFTPGNLKIM